MRFKRLGSVRKLIRKMLPTIETNVETSTWLHLSAVSTFASMLAMRRGQDSEIAAIAGLLHDYYFYKTGIKDFPGPNSADAVRPIIRGMQIFTDEELTVILRSIFYQEDRHQIHGPYEEIIKDAVLLQAYFQDTRKKPSKTDIHRLRNVFVELEISDERIGTESKIDQKMMNLNFEDRRLMLADFSEMLAGQNIIGIPEDARYREI
ncbi:HD domain-containing protein [Alicyclobacillus fodiniaquatilis]|uniref:HD domain-containing protein n=1 Tax=Alicyclobacillus fodiniaquatilis TaxID=1661150 RepID=A0ABW4JLH6_9BACL